MPVPPVPVELCVGARELTEPRLSPTGALVAWVETLQGSSRLLVQRVEGGDTVVLADAPAPRAGRGLGGGCWSWTSGDDAVVYAAADGNLWLATRGGPTRRLTDLDGSVAQAPAASADGRSVVYVVDQSEVWHLDLADRATRRIDAGFADFCFDPDIDADGRWVVWQAWDVPDMPWDGARLEGVDLRTMRHRAQRVRGALQQPRLGRDGRILCIADEAGWANVWVADRPLVEEPFEHAGPTWGLGQRSFASSPDGGRVVFSRNERGFGRLCVAAVATGEIAEIARGVHGQLSWRAERVAAIRTGARTPTQVVVYDVGGAVSRRVVDVGPHAAWNDVALAEPELVEVRASDGATVHARLYRADGADHIGLICWLHGGPTDQWDVSFMPRIAYWRSRGWHVLVPDHRGSTGHGRAYQQALRGRWGELDVTDVEDVVDHAHRAGWGTPDTTVLIGGSSGGFTVLGVLASAPSLVACGVVSYPVTDLAGLAERSHRFERHYTQTLVPVDAYASRSPVSFADRISTPLLVFHGEDDPVVPVAQSRVLVQRMRACGADVELVVYPGEGHGFRVRDHQVDEYRRIEEFLARHVPAHRGLRGR